VTKLKHEAMGNFHGFKHIQPSKTNYTDPKNKQQDPQKYQIKNALKKENLSRLQLMGILIKKY